MDLETQQRDDYVHHTPTWKLRHSITFAWVTLTQGSSIYSSRHAIGFHCSCKARIKMAFETILYGVNVPEKIDSTNIQLSQI
ncbi:hypothetical protein [Nostoc sp. 'Peltigera membranacea cyanobiont' 213]|uniref:hypothetical protein n=1 Tax=Nostoc sp. 'Peltigera membranacea cyanobiont' 213 TaxID=2014530 RepID=UPI001180B2E2|nr:hypothetical protein [Nostoc sp. 'Peltigera membranacea cyanobiont' 213]